MDFASRRIRARPGRADPPGRVGTSELARAVLVVPDFGFPSGDVFGKGGLSGFFLPVSAMGARAAPDHATRGLPVPCAGMIRPEEVISPMRIERAILFSGRAVYIRNGARIALAVSCRVFVFLCVEAIRL